MRYGKEFVELIARYCEENDIDRPSEIVIKSIANKSKTKVEIIKSVDKKIPLEDIARTLDLSRDDLFDEMYAIVSSGTKLNIDYYIEDNVDEYSRDECYEYFHTASTDDADVAFRKLKDDDVTFDEVRLMRIKFMSDKGN